MVLVTPATQRIIGSHGQPLDVNRRPVFSEEEEAKQLAYDVLGDLEDIELFFNDVLVVKYIRTQLSENIIASADTQREDRFQNGIGLVLKVGPTAFQDDEQTKFHGKSVKRGDWVMYRISDGWDRAVQRIDSLHKFADCRLIQDAHIRARVKYPGRFSVAG